MRLKAKAIKKTTEHAEQKALITWCELNRNIIPELRWIFSIPNGAYFHGNFGMINKLKSEGLKSGVADLFLPVPRGGKHGLFIEMKAGYNKQSDEQKVFENFVMRNCYQYAVCYSFEEAQAVILKYLAVLK